jgi:hypothetical protein
MTRGRKVNIHEYITNISAYLEVGCSIHEACLHGGVPYTTVKDYYDQDEEVRRKIDRLINTPILAAKKVVIQNIKEGDKDLAKWLLERKCKEEFSTRVESNVQQNISVIEIDADDSRL